MPERRRRRLQRPLRQRRAAAQRQGGPLRVLSSPRARSGTWRRPTCRAGCSGRNAAFPDWNCPGAGGPYNSAGAWGVVDRLWYLSRPTANQAFTCNRTSPTWTSNGCNAGSNWKTFRAVDDDDGNLANGTPHACQIAAAFNRHGIGNTAGSSCAGDNTTCFRACPQPPAPTLNAPTAGNNQLTLDWTPNPAPDVIDVFRNEIGCSSGFAKIAEDVSGTLYVDNEVANGTTYYYQIVRHPAGNESCASPPSNCVSGTPAAGPSAKYVGDSATLVSVPTDNDGDGFVDNCETGRIQVGIVNDGARRADQRPLHGHQPRHRGDDRHRACRSASATCR